MKRYLFYILLLASIGGATFVVLMMGEYIKPVAVFAKDGFEIMKNFVESVVNGSFKFKTDSAHIFIYGMALFIIINAAIVVTMILMWLISGFNLNRINRFYGISIWFFVSTLIMTAAYGWFYYDILQASGKSFSIADLSWYAYIPIATGIIAMVLGLVFKLTDKRN